MYTFVYRTFIKFIFFCWGQALDAPVIDTRWKSASFRTEQILNSYFSRYMRTFAFSSILYLLRIVFCRGQAPDVSRPHPFTYTYIRIARFTFVQPIEPFVSQLASNKPYMQHFENNQYINSGHSQVKDTNVLYHPLQVDTSLQC